jgi:hypothetical protein
MNKFNFQKSIKTKLIIIIFTCGFNPILYGQFCYGVSTSQPMCFGDLSQIQYSVLGCGCNSGIGPWVYRIGTTPNFSNASAIATSPLTNQNTWIFSNLPSGTYYVRVHHNGSATECTNSELSAVIASPPSAIQIAGSVSVNNIDITVFGGIAPYIYLWSNGSTTEDLSNLSPGIYAVTVTDANGCVSSQSFTILNPLISVNTLLDATCFGANNGALSISATGGTPPFNVSWSGPSSGNPAGNEILNVGGNFSISSLTAGTYTVTLTDATGNISQINGVINQPPPITITSVIGANNIDITVSGGTPGYTFSWSNGANTEDLSNLSSGTYSVFVTDANGCISTQSFTVDNVGLEQQQSVELQVFPNPTNDELTIRGNVNSLGHHSYVIQDSYGRKVLAGSFEDNEETLSVAHLAPGIYQLHVGLKTISFVVIH